MFVHSFHHRNTCHGLFDRPPLVIFDFKSVNCNNQIFIVHGEEKHNFVYVTTITHMFMHLFILVTSVMGSHLTTHVHPNHASNQLYMHMINIIMALYNSGLQFVHSGSTALEPSLPCIM